MKRKEGTYYSRNREKLLKQGSDYYYNNREQRLKYNKEYSTLNKEKVDNKNKKYFKERIKEFYWNFKKGPCMDCGVQYHPCQMEFDHRDSTLKIKNVSDLIFNQKLLVEEIAKCDLVCSNCHALRTWNRTQIKEVK